MEWKGFFKQYPEIQNNNNDTIHRDLFVESNKHPDYQNTIIDNVRIKLFGWITNKEFSEPRSNLSIAECIGQKWLLEMTKKQSIFISKADKGGATLILNYHTVAGEIQKELFDERKYEALNVKPDVHCAAVADKAKEMIINLNSRNIISDKDKTLITGLNKNNNMKHAPEYRAEHPYIYPLFKIHKLNEQEIKSKNIPPCRMVNAAKNGPLYRMEKWISPYLSSSSQVYCQNEFLLDTPHLIELIKDYNANESNNEGNIYLFTMDVKSLYPSIKPELALEAVADYLNSDITLDNNLKTIIENFVKFILEESFATYKNKCYKPKVGIPTGGCNSRQIADIFLQWLLFKIVNPVINEWWSFVKFWKRYIDDCIGLWTGNKEGFEEFLTKLNKETEKFGICFPIEETQFGKSVNFLDLNIYLDEENKINYRLFIKPTDARRYLNPSSFHPKHVFNSIPFSQMLRIIKRNSKHETCISDINTIKTDLTKSGYNQELLESCEIKAFQKVDEPGEELPSENNTIVFTVDYFENLKEFKNLISDIQEDIKPLLGDIKIKLSTRKNSSIGNLLVKNRSLCAEMSLSDNQKCGDRRCGVCPLMFTGNSTSINNKELKIPKNLSCKSKDCIYLCVCSQCSQNNSYFGKTMQEYHNRMTGHRQSFNINKFMKSALSMHAYDCHDGETNLSDYKLAVIKTVPPRRLRREEFIFIDKYETQTKGLNRYQVV